MEIIYIQIHCNAIISKRLCNVIASANDINYVFIFKWKFDISIWITFEMA